MNPKPVIFEGKAYPSIKNLAECHGVTVKLYRKRLARGWTMKDALLTLNSGNAGSVPIAFRGKIYSSYVELAEAFGVSPNVFYWRRHNAWTLEEALNLVERSDTPEKLGCVYMIKNAVTGKSYIGLTTLRLSVRLSAHFSNAKRFNTKLSMAMRAYPTEAFSIHALTGQKPQSELSAIERRLIQRYGTVSQGYNTSPGGATGSRRLRGLAETVKIPYTTTGRAKQMAKEWGTITPGFGDKVKLADLIPLADKESFTNKFRSFRFLPSVISFMEVWIPIYRKGEPLMGPKGAIRVPKTITTYDPETEKLTSDDCPYLKLVEQMNKYLPEKDQLRPSRKYLSLAIDRKLQEAAPRRQPRPTKKELASGFKDMESETFTPVVGVLLTSPVASKLQGLQQLNKVTIKKDGKVIKQTTKPISDPRYGCDVSIKFDPKQKGAAMYDVSRDGRTPLTEEELAYLTFDLDNIIKPEKTADAKAEADRILKEFMVGKKKKASAAEDDSDDDVSDLEDDEEEAPKKKTNKRRAAAEDDDEDDVPFDGGKRIKTRKPPVDEDDDDDLDESDLEDDEDDAPPVKSNKRRAAVEDDEDEDEPAPRKKVTTKKRVLDEDEDEPAPKKPVKRRAQVDDEDEDEAPPVKSNKRRAAVVDDEDEDEPAPRKKVTTKKRVVDEDDEDDAPPAKSNKRRAPVDEDDGDLEDLDDADEDEDEVITKVKPKKKIRR